MNCTHETFFCSDYGTRICQTCGSEKTCGLPTSDQYTTNCPLVVGYSRNARVKSILEKLFMPYKYGNPCQEIVYIIKRDQLTFVTGMDLHHWLNSVPIKQKKYTCCHYYYAIANKHYDIPPPPCQDLTRKVLRKFNCLEMQFNSTRHPYKSFFSYNWLLRRLLMMFHLEHYVQFIKPIKCSGRRRMYSRMFSTFIQSQPSSCTRVKDPARVLSSPQQPFSLQDYAYQSLRQLSSGVSDPSIKNLLSMPRNPTGKRDNGSKPLFL